MSELNNDLNEEIDEVIDDATVMTVPIDDTLTVSGEAADAKAVGDALALKADLSDVQNIKVNNQSADNQGQIYIDGEDIPMSGSDSTTLKAAITAATGKTGATIPLTGEQGAPTIAAKVTAIDAKTASSIEYSTGVTIADAIAAIDEKDATDIASGTGTIQDALDGLGARLTAIEADYLKAVTQSLTTDQKVAVRGNLGLGTSATNDVANNLTTVDSGSVLDARQGKVLSDSVATHTSQITALQAANARINMTDQITFDNLASGNTAIYQTDTLKCYRFGNMCHLEFGIKFSSSQSANALAWKADFHGLPKISGTRVTGVCGAGSGSIFTYIMDTNYEMTIRFVYIGSASGSTATYTMSIEYVIDDNAGETTPEE